MAKLVSNTYGDALFELALETDKLDVMLEEVKSISTALKDNVEMTRLMNHPKIVKEEKIYPNDPCPCGSGKKYKKCCGRNK